MPPEIGGSLRKRYAPDSPLQALHQPVVAYDIKIVAFASSFETKKLIVHLGRVQFLSTGVG
eukprot:394092-Pelagomonas_calceolata.AAC.5